MTTATSSTTPSTTSSTTSLASSAKFKTFVIVYAIVHPVTYVICVIWQLPLFTYHPATNRIVWGYEAARSGEGPNMTWYGWVATTVLVGLIVGMVATMLPERVTSKIPLALVWLLPMLAIPVMAYTLMFFWTHP
jgi:hypothetical protein